MTQPPSAALAPVAAANLAPGGSWGVIWGLGGYFWDIQSYESANYTRSSFNLYINASTLFEMSFNELTYQHFSFKLVPFSSITDMSAVHYYASTIA